MENRKTIRVLPLVLCCILGMLCAKAFGINPLLYVGKSSIPADSTDYIWTFLGLTLTALFAYAYIIRSIKPRVITAVSGLLFGVLNYFGTTLFAYDSWDFIGVFQSWFTVIFKCSCQGFVMMTALSVIVCWLEDEREPHVRPAFGGFFEYLWKLWEKHPVLVSMAILIFCWLPYLVLFYPGIIISDMAWMFEQLVGITPMTTWHSVLITWVFGGCVLLGRALGSDALGCVLYMALQTICISYALSRVLALLKRKKIGWRWQAGALAFFALFPIWPMYAATIWKDTIHTGLLLIWLLETIEWCYRISRFGRGRWLCYAGLSVIICLWRNNGLYVVLPSLLAFQALARKGERLRLGGITAIVIAASMLFQNVLIPALGIVDNTASGIYSVCFQQTARVVRGHRSELTEEEKAEIDRVLDVNMIGYIYEPWISDPVKYTFRQYGQGADIEKEALSRYRKTWLSMMPKYPVEYIQAFMAGNRGYYSFTPKYTGITYSQQAGMRFVPASFSIEGEGELNAPQPAALNGLRSIVYNLLERLRTLPILQMLFTCPVYTWTLVGAAIALMKRKRCRELALFCPALMSFAVCLVSPVDDYFRYFLPVIAMTVPLLTCVKRGEREHKRVLLSFGIVGRFPHAS